MVILIDGYNLLKGVSGGKEINEEERQAFIHKIGIYSKRKKHKTIIVFDGGASTWPYKAKVAGVVVIYSGSKQTADKVIKQYIIDHPTKDILLVTTDRDLNQFANKRGKVSIDSQDFLVLLQELLASPIEVMQEEWEVIIDDEETDLAVIMEQATAKVPYKTEDRLHAIKQSSSAMSKKDRLLLKKLKKL